MSNLFFSGRIAPSLHDHVAKFCEETGKSKTEVLVEALTKYTGFTQQEKDTKHTLSLTEQIQSLQKEVYELRKIVEAHADKINFIENKNSLKKHNQLTLNISADNTDNNVISLSSIDCSADFINTKLKEYRNLTQRGLCNLSKNYPKFFIEHRKNLQKRGLPLNTPIEITINSQKYHAICTIAEGQNVKWDAVPVENT